MLLVGHGSRSEAGRRELLDLAALVAEAVPEVPVEVGFLELSDPPAGVAVDRLVARGARRLSVLPLMLNPGGHAKSDVPAVVAAARRRHPDVDVHYGRPLGPDQQLLRLAADRLAAAGASGLPLAVLARGTSDPDANADAYKAARLVAEANGSRLVEVGFSGITWPTVPDALAHLVAKGSGPLACFAWFLCTGLLVERMQRQFAEVAASTGVTVIDAGHLGADPAVVPVVLERHHEALGATIRMNCDVCAYRRPFPGLEDRVGQPIGVGHSHLAAEHQHHHQPDGDHHHGPGGSHHQTDGGDRPDQPATHDHPDQPGAHDHPDPDGHQHERAGAPHAEPAVGSPTAP